MRSARTAIQLHPRRAVVALLLFVLAFCQPWIADGTSASEGKLRYLHDADGQRVARIQIAEDTTTGEKRTNIVRYLYDTQAIGGYSQRLVELENGKPVRLFVRGVGPVAEWKRSADAIGAVNGSPSFRVSDGHGSTRLQIDQGGASSSRKEYDAFGVGLAPREAAADGWGYTGEFWDSSLQQLDLRARTYDPSVGRFSVMDRYEGRLDDPDGLNKYLYCNAEPVNGIDPSGNFVDVGSNVFASEKQSTLRAAQDVGTAVGKGVASRTIARAVGASAVLLQSTADHIHDPGFDLDDESRTGDSLVVRGGIATPDQLMKGVAEHLAVPGLIGFSVQSESGVSIQELAAAGRFRNRQISVSTAKALASAGRLIGYSVQVIKSAGVGYHCTVTTPAPLPERLARLLSATFTIMRNPNPSP